MNGSRNNGEHVEDVASLNGDLLSMIRTAQTMAVEAQESIKAAHQMRRDLTPVLGLLAQDNLDFQKKYQQSMLNQMVDVALRITGADMGNLQLFDPSSNSLCIKAQRGFGSTFLEFFGSVYDGQAACGMAFNTRKRVIVADVVESPIFVGTAALEILLDAGVRAVQSTPLIGTSGLLGIISTHWASPYCPRSRDLFSLDVLARTASGWMSERLPVIHSSVRASFQTRQD